MSLEFFFTSLILILLPGTGVIYTLAIGLGRGFGPSVAAAFGCTLGIVPAALASILGLSALLHTSALAFQIIKIAGLIYLLYMAIQIVRDGGMLDTRPDPNRKLMSLRTIAVRGTLLNVLNPKLSLFFLAFLPQFVEPAQGLVPVQLVTLALWFMGLTFMVFVGYGACASLARTYIFQRPGVMRTIRYVFGGCFGLLGVRLALSSNAN